MEEVEDLVPEEEVEIIPEPPPLVRSKSKLTEKVTCEGCGKSLSLHAYRYSHKCKARAPDEPPPPVETPEPKKRVRIDSAKLKDDLKDDRPALPQAQSIQPIRPEAVIQRTPEYPAPEPPYEPYQQDLYQHLLQQRQQQEQLLGSNMQL